MSKKIDDTNENSQVRFVLRVPSDLHQALTRRARANGRSMNSEIVAILTEQFEDQNDLALRHMKLRQAMLASRVRDLTTTLKDTEDQLEAVMGEIAMKHLTHDRE